ncbi:MAG: DNA replication and repair protein RecF [Chitinophagales bacterium]|jgi:DNA replication and repair protein RecF|nr:DNA replication and repair protein RecF [Chitinophagales bacterium]
MHLSKISLYTFKNHSALDIAFNSRYISIIGRNGIGKSNVLDAIFYSAYFKSFFPLSDAQLIKQGSDFFRLDYDFLDSYNINYPSKKLSVKYQHKKKYVAFDQIEIKSIKEQVGQIPIVMTTPNDVYELFGSSDERRKYIDYSISNLDLSYLDNIIQYNHVLKQRNALLKQDNETKNLELLRIYQTQLESLGIPIFQARQVFFQQFIPLVNAWYHRIAEQNEDLEIDYFSQLHECSFQEGFQMNLSKDIALGRTRFGIHRDDIIFKLNDMEFRKVASQGQQKSLLYALKFAQAQYMAQNKKVIFLLDDFSDKLDVSRIENLKKIITGIDFVSQWFFSDTKSISGLKDAQEVKLDI